MPGSMDAHFEDALIFPNASGQAVDLLRAVAWDAHPLGRPERWPPALRIAVGLILNSPASMFLIWKEGETFFFNDAYAGQLGPRLPYAMGARTPELLADAWPAMEPLVAKAMAGEASRFEDMPVPMARYGEPEDTWWSFSCSPFLDEAGEIVALFCITDETTKRVLTERRLAEERLSGAQALSQSEAHWRGLFEKLEEAFILGELVRDDKGEVIDWRYVDVNAAWGRMVEMPSDAAVGRTIRQMFPAIEDTWIDEMARVVESREGGAFTRQMGSLGRWYEGRAFALEGDRFGVLFVEVTAREQADSRRDSLLELYDRSRDLTDPGDLAALSAEILVRTLDVGRAGYGTVDPIAETIVIEREWTAKGVSPLPDTLSFRDHGSYIDDLLRGETVVVGDAETDPRTSATSAALEAIGARSFVNMPIVEQDGFVALLYLTDTAVRAWSAADLDFIRAVAERTRLAVARRRAEQDLRDLAASLEQQVQDRTRERDRIWQVSKDLLGVADMESVWLSVNPAWTRALGWPADQIIGRNSAWLLHPDDRIKTQLQRERLAAGDVAPVFENRLQTREGDYRLLSWTVVPADGRLYCVGRDVTAEREQARVLREFEDFTRLALSAVGGVGVWTYDVASDRFFCDAAISELYALDPEEAAAGISRDRFLANVHPDDRATLRKTMTGGLVRQGDLELEYRIRHPDGSVRWVLSRGHTYFDEGGAPVRRAGVGIETTRQHHTQDQLRQSQKMEAVGQLTGGIAHDFNNLLTGITGSLELLETRISQGRLKDVGRYITAAQGAAKRAAALTHRLLAFSRRQTLDPAAIDVNRLIAGMEELIRRSIGPQITLEVVGAAGLWPALVDANQLENALLNLCINARDAMPNGGRITIETANKWLDNRAAQDRDLPAGQYLSLCVTDTGAGMTPEVIARAFDPFFTTKPMGQGTGLGLSMIYGFVRQSGGQVRIYTELGQGTTMCLYLPRHFGPAEALAEDSPVSMAPRAQQGETVLVIDDEPTVRMLVTEVLEDLGYTAIEAAEGLSGLKLLQSDRRIDLLVTDVGLPGGLNGRQVADAARATRPDLKVLFITGYAENAAVGNGHLEPGMHLLTKPFAMEVLAGRIRDLINNP